MLKYNQGRYLTFILCIQFVDESKYKCAKIIKVNLLRIGFAIIGELSYKIDDVHPVFPLRFSVQALKKAEFTFA